MPSLRSKFCRILTKYLVAPKFNPHKTIDEARRGMESLTKLASLPSKTKVQKITIKIIEKSSAALSLPCTLPAT
jgi:hypothetical protein